MSWFVPFSLVQWIAERYGRPVGADGFGFSFPGALPQAVIVSARLGLSRIEIRGAFDCQSAFKRCVHPPLGLPQWKKGFCILRLSPEIEVGVSAKAVNHRDEPEGKMIRLFEAGFFISDPLSAIFLCDQCGDDGDSSWCESQSGDSHPPLAEFVDCPIVHEQLRQLLYNGVVCSSSESSSISSDFRSSSTPSSHGGG